MSTDQAARPGLATSEWKATLIVTAVNLAVGLLAGPLASWGVAIDADTLATAILSNTGLAASYTLGRSHLKAKALTP